MGKERKHIIKKNRILKGAAVLLLIFAVLLFGLCGLAKVGELRLEGRAKYGAFAEEGTSGDYDEVVWQGETYAYREHLVTILCMGVDGRGSAVENIEIGQGPRSDALYLAVLDLDKKSLTFLNISRDSIAKIRVFDSLGVEVGLVDAQITLQYANGDGLTTSCERTCAAVSRLLNGIPIDAYCALYWNAIKPLTDTIGPVPVEVPEYMTWVNPPVFHNSGYTELDGRQALEFVRERDIEEAGSNEVRSVYQQEFLQSLYTVTKEKVRRNPLMVWQIWKSVEDYVVTDLTPDQMLALGSFAASWNMKELDIRSLPGECVEGRYHDEFWVDEAGKQELLLELFYEKEAS